MRFQLFTALLVFAFLGLFFIAGGCGKVPMASMMKLARVDFDTTDLTAVRAAILLPEDLRPLSGTGRLSIVVRRGDGSSENHVFALKEIDDAEAAMLNEETEGSGRIFAYRLSSPAVHTLDRLRAEVLAKRGTGAEGSKLTLSIAARACHIAGRPSGPLPITTYLKTEETKSFVPLVRRIDLRALAGDEPLDLVPCPDGSSA